MAWKLGNALLAAVMFFSAVGLEPADAKKEKKVKEQKTKIIPGVNDVFKGIMTTAGQVTMSDPLWERYAYAGKKALERRDIESAQKYYWSACFELEDIASGKDKVPMDNLAHDVLIDLLSLSRDVFFQDPHSADIQSTPPAFPQDIMPDEIGRVDAEMKRLNDEQTAFDQKHPDFDPGARLRMIHLRRRIEFTSRMIPVMKKLYGTDDGVTRIVTEAFNTDTREFKDIGTQG